jgi:hypothetical protein
MTDYLRPCGFSGFHWHERPHDPPIRRYRLFACALVTAACNETRLESLASNDDASNKYFEAKDVAGFTTPLHRRPHSYRARYAAIPTRTASDDYALSLKFKGFPVEVA